MAARHGENGHENAPCEIRSNGFCWRENEENYVASNMNRSHGIAPDRFHKSTAGQPRSGQKQVREALIAGRKQRMIEINRVKYSAYKKITVLEQFPLQDLAMKRFRELMSEHLHEETADDHNESIVSPDDHTLEALTQASSAVLSQESSSSSSSSELYCEEVKRTMRNFHDSPAQSRKAVQYEKEFLDERALARPLPVNYRFGSPLWSMEPRIFTRERSATSSQQYIVGHMGRFLDKYWRKVEPKDRCFYEMIPEGTPCRMYFDIEYSKESNPGISQDDAEQMLDELLVEINKDLIDRFNIGPIDRALVVDLDSSTTVKFSRHWILHLPGGTLFKNNASVGNFVRDLISRLAQDHSTGQLGERHPMMQKHLFVRVPPRNADTSKMTCFIDTGVYTRNRLFRLLGSSKFGKSSVAALRLADRNRFPFRDGFANENFYLPAMAAKREHKGTVPDDTVGNPVEEVIQEFIAATDWNPHADALVDTLVVPLNVSKLSFPTLTVDENPLETRKTLSTTIASSGKVTYTHTSSSLNKSPYPIIDDFVQEHLASRRGTTKGCIRAWAVVCASDGRSIQIVYQMSRNRWCECIGREHKSNNIIWTVDLELWQCVQSCHDPDCRQMGFRGSPIPLPENIRDAVSDVLLEECLLRLDESKLLSKSSTKGTPVTEIENAFQQLDIHLPENVNDGVSDVLLDQDLRELDESKLLSKSSTKGTSVSEIENSFQKMGIHDNLENTAEHAVQNSHATKENTGSSADENQDRNEPSGVVHDDVDEVDKQDTDYTDSQQTSGMSTHGEITANEKHSVNSQSSADEFSSISDEALLAIAAVSE